VFVCVFLSMSVSFSDLVFHPKGSARCKEKDEEHRKSTEESPDRGNSRGILGFSAEFQSCYPLLSHRIPDVVNKLNILDESPTPFYGLHKNLEDYCFRVFFLVFVLFSSLPLWFLWLLWVCGFCGFTMFCLSIYLSIYISIYLSIYLLYLSFYLSI